MTYLTNTFVNRDKRYRLTWIPGDSYEKLTPITQAYGFCFNDQDKLLVIQASNKKVWQVPGGTPEAMESPEKALRREIEEEANVTIRDIHYIGAQKNEDSKGTFVYQLRFACRVERVNERKKDPDRGYIIPRNFIEPAGYAKISGWGLIGDDMVKKAAEKFNIKI